VNESPAQQPGFQPELVCAGDPFVTKLICVAVLPVSALMIRPIGAAESVKRKAK